jgi:hypothetical protein
MLHVPTIALSSALPATQYKVFRPGPQENSVIWQNKNIKREKLLQIMCFQSQMLEFFYLGLAVTALHSLHYQK